MGCFHLRFPLPSKQFDGLGVKTDFCVEPAFYSGFCYANPSSGPSLLHLSSKLSVFPLQANGNGVASCWKKGVKTDLGQPIFENHSFSKENLEATCHGPAWLVSNPWPTKIMANQTFFWKVNFIQSLNTKYRDGAKIAPLKVFQSHLDSIVSRMRTRLTREQARARNGSLSCFLCEIISHCICVSTNSTNRMHHVCRGNWRVY